MSDPASPVLAAIARALEASDFENASDLGVQALAKGIIHPAFFNAQALWQERQGKDEAALALYTRARELAPKDATILNARGLCLARVGRLDDAIDEFDAAIRVRPDHALSYYRRGRTLWQAGRLAEAEGSLKKALSFDAQKPDVLAALAAVVAARGDLSMAASYARRALQSAPNDPIAVSVAAAAELQSGKNTEAEARLRKLLDVPHLGGQSRAMALGLYGRATRALGRADDSYDAYAERNALVMAERPDTQQAVQQLRTFCQVITSLPSASWRPLGPEGEPQEQLPDVHIFLCGLPRSGSEILANVLGRHKGIALLREVDRLDETSFGLGRGSYSIAGLDNEGAAALRKKYWSAVQKVGLSVTAKVLIDCTPANLLQLPFIAKLFPRARILFLQRDPRDVLSSWFAELPRVPSWLPVPDLAKAAELFDETAKIVRTARDRMPLPIAVVRYETLIADPEASLSAICEFAGLGWDRSAFERPSSREDDAGYDAEPSGVWRIWEARLAPLSSLLAPWLEAWGYD